MKNRFCARCVMRKHCHDLPGFCLLLPYAAILAILVLLAYFFYNDTL